MTETSAGTARISLLRRASTLELLTIGWDATEGAVAIRAGLAAGSIALVGFGLDSAIEIVSAVALFARLRGEIRTREINERAEALAVRIVGVTFFLLATYVAWEAVSTLVHREQARESLVGIVLAAVALVVMPWLGWAKMRIGRSLGSAALVADAKETFACGYLSFALLLGLGLNALFGWWWADPAAALIMVPFLVREGWEAFEEEDEEVDEGEREPE
ncbi:MAG: cation transporter [Thermoanaerobaculia bacterium]